MPRSHYRLAAEIEAHWAPPMTVPGVPSQQVAPGLPISGRGAPGSPLPRSRLSSPSIKQLLVSDRIL